MIINEDRIEIKVRGPEPNNEIGIFLPWHATIEDWKVAFKTILIHQTFTEDTVKELFFDEDYHEFIKERPSSLSGSLFELKEYSY